MGTKRIDKDEIFNTAAEIADADERTAYVEEACAEDPELRAEIEELLENDRAEDSLLDRFATGVGPSLDQPIAEHPGAEIDRYKLLEQIGEGGFGVVYVADQTEPVRRQVALKIIKPGMDSGQVLARFEAERQALAMMDHPHIAKVLDGGCTDTGRPYFVMELVKGVSITKYCDECQLGISERLQLFSAVCLAVQHAHQKGVIHRDLKPSNVLVAMQDGHPAPKIIDFGVAKAIGQKLTEHTLRTQFTQMVGTPMYMSPEQAELSPIDIDTRSDIYSLGVLLYELLTGATPFASERLREAAFDELRRIIREEEPPRPSTLAAKASSTLAETRRMDSRHLSQRLRGELDWIVMKALAKDRTRRYESANDLAADIERHLCNEPVLARPTSAFYRIQKLTRRNRVLVASMAAILVALTVGYAISATLAALRFSGLAEETRNQLYDADMNRVPQLIDDGDFVRAIRILDSHKPSDKQADLRGMEWFMYRHKCEAAASGHTLRHRAKVYCGEYSPNGKILATAGNYGTIHLWQADTLGKLHTLEPDHGRICSLVFRSDDELISAGGDGKIWFWDVPSGNPTRLALDAPIDFPDLYSLSLSRDGNKLAAGYYRNETLYPSGKPGFVTVWDLDSDKMLAHLDDLTGNIHAVTFLGDGEQLVAGDETGKIRIWRTSDWRLEKTVDAHSEGVFCLALSPDGKLLATGSGIRNGQDFDQGEIKIWDTKTWDEPKYCFSLHANRIRSLDFRNDGTLIAGSYDGRISLWDTATGHQLLSFGAHTAEILSVRFSPNGQSICSTSIDSTARIWDRRTLFASLRESDVYREHDAIVINVAFIQGGREACTIDASGNFHIWDTQTGETTVRRDKVLGICSDLAVSRDSRVLGIATGSEPWGEGPGWVRVFDRTNLAAIPDRPLWHEELESGFLRGIEFSPNGSVIAYGTGKEFQVRSVSTGELVAAFDLDGQTLCIRFSRDGSKVACTTYDGSTYILQTSDYRPVHRLDSDRGVTYCVDFSPDGQTLITGGEDNVIKIWDASSFQLLGKFEPCTSTVTCLLYSPDGTRVVSSTIDGTVQIWRTQTRTSAFEARDQTAGTCVNLAISRDGLLFASGVDAVRVWRVPEPNTVFRSFTTNE